MSVVAPVPVCVYCRRRPVEPGWQPFCSRRCQLLDLAAWTDGSYRIAAGPVSADDDLPPSSTDDHETP